MRQSCRQRFQALQPLFLVRSTPITHVFGIFVRSTPANLFIGFVGLLIGQSSHELEDLAVAGLAVAAAEPIPSNIALSLKLDPATNLQRISAQISNYINTKKLSNLFIYSLC